MKVRYYIYNRD